MRMRQWISGGLAVLMLAVTVLSVMPVKAEAATDTGEAQAARLKEVYTMIFPTGNASKPSFFTENGKPCTTHPHNKAGSCLNCSLEKVLGKLYKQDPNKFGAAYNLFHSGNMGGKTCVGFQRFVWLYVYGEKVWENENYIFQQKKPTYELFSKLKPGDSVDIMVNGSRSHAMIFLSCTENNVTFLDANWFYGKGISIVSVHTNSYEDLCTGTRTGYTYSARRAKNAAETEAPYTTVSLDPTYLMLPVGESFDFAKGQAMATTAKQSELVWDSSNTAIATVSAGKVIAKASGEVAITATTPSGSIDRVTINVVKPAYNCAEKWTTISTELGPRVSASSSASRAARYSGGYYVIKKSAELQILAKTVDSSGTTWGFGTGYSNYLGQNIWGWINLKDKKLGSEQFGYSYVPSAPEISVTKTSSSDVTVSWKAVAQATSYKVYQNDTLIAEVTGTSKAITMAANEKVSFRVEAVNANFPYQHLIPCVVSSKAISIVMPAAACSHSYTNACDTSCNTCGATRSITHSYATKWSSDGTNHWHVCSICGTKKDTAKHTYFNNCDASCNSCGATRSITHSYAAKWSSDGTNHWHACSVCGVKKDTAKHTYSNNCDTSCNSCGATRSITHSYAAKWSSDGTNHWHACVVCGVKKDNTKHTPGDAATETKPQTCTACGYVLKAALGHTHKYADSWSANGVQHWKVCACGAKQSIGAHSFDHACDTACNTCGYTRTTAHSLDGTWLSNVSGHWQKCTICQVTMNKAAHTPGAAAAETTPQTCKTCGYVLKGALGHSHTYDSTWISDENGHWHLCTCGAKGDEAAHTWNAGITQTDGSKLFTCTVCNTTKTEAAPFGGNTGNSSGSGSTGSGDSTDPGSGSAGGDENTGGEAPDVPDEDAPDEGSKDDEENIAAVIAVAAVAATAFGAGCAVIWFVLRKRK